MYKKYLECTIVNFNNINALHVHVTLTVLVNKGLSSLLVVYLVFCFVFVFFGLFSIFFIVVLFPISAINNDFYIWV